MDKLITLDNLNKNNNYINNNINARLIDNAAKNLLKVDTVTSYDILFSVDDDSYITAHPNNIDARLWRYTYCQWHLTLPKGKYKIFYECSLATSNTSADIQIIAEDETRIVSGVNIINQMQAEADFILDNTTNIGVQLKCYEAKCRLMICRADIIDSTFEPYYHTQKQIDSDLTEINTLLTDNACKNLLNITASSSEVKGITFTVNSDKSITINGTAVGTAWFTMDYAIDGGLASAHQPIPKGWLRASLDKNIVAGVILGGTYFKEDGTAAVAFRLIPTAGIPYVYGEYPSDAYRMRTYLQVDDGTTINNVTVYPMIRRADITDDTFEPYYRTNKQLDSDLIGMNTLLIDNACKNLFDYDKWVGTEIYNGTATYENYGVTLTANGDDCYTMFGCDKTVNIPVESNKTYILSWDININKTTASDLTTSLVVMFFNGVMGSQRFANADSKTLTFTVPENTTFVTIRFGVQNNGDTIAYENIMLRRAGIIDDTFEPYYRTQKQLDKDLSNMIYRNENGSTVLTSYTIDSTKDDAYIIIKPEGDSGNLSIIDGDEFTIHNWTNVDFDNINAINMKSKSLDITSETSFKLNIGYGGGTIATNGNTLLINSYNDRIDITSYDRDSGDSFSKANEINIAYDGDPLEILSYSGGISMYSYNGSNININANNELHLIGNTGIYMSTKDTSDMYISTNYVSITGTTGIDFEGNDIKVKLSGMSTYATLKQYIQGVVNGTY